MNDKIASLKISGMETMGPNDRIRLKKWLKKVRKEIRNNPRLYSDKCEFSLMK